MEWITDPAAWLALLTLTVLEIVLGIDNIIFLSIMTGKLPPEKQPKARVIGLLLAMLMRVVIPAATLLLAAGQVAMSAFMFEVLRLAPTRHAGRASDPVQ